MAKSRLVGLIEVLLPGIRSQARKRSTCPAQADDFAQEALVAVIKAYPRYRKHKRTKEEMVAILGTVARNAIIDQQRKSIKQHEQEVMPESEDAFDAISGASRFPHHGDDTETRELTVVIRERLSHDAARVFDEKLEPSEKTERLIAEENRKRTSARNKGFFTVTISHVTHAAIARSLGLDVNEVARASAEIKMVARSVIRG